MSIVVQCDICERIVDEETVPGGYFRVKYVANGVGGGRVDCCSEQCAKTAIEGLGEPKVEVRLPGDR